MSRGVMVPLTMTPHKGLYTFKRLAANNLICLGLDHSHTLSVCPPLEGW